MLQAAKLKAAAMAQHNRTEAAWHEVRMRSAPLRLVAMDETTATLLADLKAAIADLEAGNGDPERVADLARRVERRLEAETELREGLAHTIESFRRQRAVAAP